MSALNLHSTALSLLNKYFNYAEFRKGQYEIIESVCLQSDALVIMPTGGGKSLCYQIPALILPGCALIVSPLIALMKDQVDALLQRGIPAAVINSTLSLQEQDSIRTAALSGSLKLLYISPERLQNEQFIQFLNQLQLSLIAIDEAHCISEWGHDFRPAYTLISKALQQLLKKPVTVALTATATPEVQQDIIQHLGLQSPFKHIGGFNRSNLHYQVVTTNKKASWITEYLRENTNKAAVSEGATLIYCGSRKRVEEFSATLKQSQIPVLTYHAGLPDGQRKRVQEQFIKEKAPVLLATNAFGMGIDKSNVRTVIHCDLTLTLEAYYQEAGRAGRDGLDSQCILLYTPSDRDLMEFFLSMTYPSKSDIMKVYQVLYAQTPLHAYQTSPIFMSQEQIGNACGVHVSAVQSAMMVMQKAGILTSGSSNKSVGMIRILAKEEELKHYINALADDKKAIVIAILRSIGAEAFLRPVPIDIQNVLRKHQLQSQSVEEALRIFELSGMIQTTMQNFGNGITLLRERFSPSEIPVNFQEIEKRYNHAVRKLNSMQNYAETVQCKRNYILEYFQDIDSNPQQCGTCSSCLAHKQKKTVKKKVDAQEQFIRHSLLVAIAELDGRFGRKTIISTVLGDIKDQNVKKYFLHKAQSFARLKGMALFTVTDTLTSLVSDGLVHISAGQYPLIALVEKGRLLLKEDVQPMNIRYEQNQETLVLKKLYAVRASIGAHDPAIHDYFHNAVLETLAKLMPTNSDDIARLCNLPPDATKMYAPLFLAEISALRSDDNYQDASISQTAKITLSLIQQGMELYQIAELRGVTIGTIAQHIQILIEQGIEIPRKQFVSNELYKQVSKLYKKMPYALLKELRQHIGEAYEYAELRIALAFVKAHDQ